MDTDLVKAFFGTSDANDMKVLELALKALGERFDEFIGLAIDGKITPQAIARYRAYLPPGSKHAYQTKGANRE